MKSYLEARPNRRGGLELPAGGMEDIGKAEIGLSNSWRFAEPESEEVTSSGSTSFRVRFFEAFGLVSSSSSPVCGVLAEGIEERPTTLSKARPSMKEGVPVAGGLLMGIARS